MVKLVDYYINPYDFWEADYEDVVNYAKAIGLIPEKAKVAWCGWDYNKTKWLIQVIEGGNNGI